MDIGICLGKTTIFIRLVYPRGRGREDHVAKSNLQQSYNGRKCLEKSSVNDYVMKISKHLNPSMTFLKGKRAWRRLSAMALTGKYSLFQNKMPNLNFLTVKSPDLVIFWSTGLAYFLHTSNIITNDLENCMKIN